MKTIRNNSAAAFTSAEMVVSTMVMAILGIVFLNVLNSGMILYAKNTAVNSAHEEGREGVNRLTRDLHAPVSVQQLHTSTLDWKLKLCTSLSVTNLVNTIGAAITSTDSYHYASI